VSGVLTVPRLARLPSEPAGPCDSMFVTLSVDVDSGAPNVAPTAPRQCSLSLEEALEILVSTAPSRVPEAPDSVGLWLNPSFAG